VAGLIASVICSPECDSVVSHLSSLISLNPERYAYIADSRFAASLSSHHQAKNIWADDLLIDALRPYPVLESKFLLFVFDA